MHNRKILIIGEVYVDQHLDIIENGYSTSRLGGIFHAARSCDALNIEYALAYYAPDYPLQDNLVHNMPMHIMHQIIL